MNKLKITYRYLLSCVALLLCFSNGFSQTTLVNYDFNSGTSYATLSPTTAANITSTATSTEAWQTYTGISSGTNAFTVNSIAGTALAMTNSSGTNTRYFQFNLGGSNLSIYSSYKMYLQAQRSATGASTITLAYSTDGTNYTNFATTQSPGDGVFNECQFNLSTITAINSQSTVYFRVLASGASGTGTLRIDNLQIQATPCSTPTLSITPSAQTICAGSSATLTASGATSYTWNPGGITTASVSVTPTTTTVYTITGSNSACISSQTMMVTVNPIPTIIISNPTPSITIENSAILTASGATNYTWNPVGVTTASVSVSPNMTMTYTVIGESLGCINTQTSTIIVNTGSSVILVNYDFNSGTSYATLSPTTAANITSTATSTEAWQTYLGTVNGANAFTVNAVSGNALAMSNSSGTNTRYFQFNLGGSNLPIYSSYKMYLQAQRSATGASTITLAYSTDGTNYTNFATTQAPGDGVFNECQFNLSTITAINSQSTVYFRVLASGASAGTGTLRIDNLQIQATPCSTPTLSITPSTQTICAGNSATLTASGATSYTWNPGGIITATISVTPTTTTVYTVTGSNSACVSSQTTSVSVTPLPTLSITPSAQTICAGNSTTLTASGATSYTWNPGGITTTTISVTPTTTTVYTVTGSNLGCTGSQTLMVTVNPIPTITISNPTPSITIGNSAILTASGATNYTWNPVGVTTASVSVSPNMTMTYTVIGESLGCVNTQTSTIIVNIVSNVILANYDFNSGTSYATLSPTTAANITSTAGSTEPWQIYLGTASGVNAFSANTISGDALAMSNSSGTNTRYFQFNLGGSNLPIYSSYKMYLQAQRSATGASTITLAYSTDGTNYTNFATTQAPGDGVFNECQFNLSTITAINSQSTVYFRVLASGASGTGTLRIDNLQIQATPCSTPTLSITPSAQTICAGNSATLTASGASTYSWNTGATASSIVVSPSVATSYSIIGTNCSSTNTTSISLQISNLIINAGMDEFVSAGTIVVLGGAMVATGGISPYIYNWLPAVSYTPSASVSNPTTTVNSATIFSLTVTDNIGCTKTTQKSVYVINEPYFLVLGKTLDAGFYNTKNQKIYFSFEEEYFDSSTSSQLDYKIVNDNNTPLNLSSIPLAATTEKIGDNRFQIDLSSLGLSTNTFYRIAITNKKKEVWYARFKYL